MAKAGLLEAQSSEGVNNPPAGTTLETGGAPCPVIYNLARQLPWRAAPPSEGGQGDEWAAYVVLDTYNEDVPRDRLQGASPKATECP